jgi:hypothetical protein
MIKVTVEINPAMVHRGFPFVFYGKTYWAKAGQTEFHFYSYALPSTPPNEKEELQFPDGFVLRYEMQSLLQPPTLSLVPEEFDERKHLRAAEGVMSSGAGSTSMQSYFGSKRLKASPMSLSDYNRYRGWKQPAGETDAEGYLVEYEDGGSSNHEKHAGYISWSPKDVFEKAYRPVSGMTFGHALEIVKAGGLIKRAGWNGKGMFVFMRPADELTPAFIVDKVKYLPQTVKTHIAKKYGNETHYSSGDEIKVKFTPYLCMYAADGSIVNGWLASQTDMLAEDWEELTP